MPCTTNSPPWALAHVLDDPPILPDQLSGFVQLGPHLWGTGGKFAGSMQVLAKGRAQQLATIVNGKMLYVAEVGHFR
ncbi:hypothetical protein NDU88_005711 [Pleurodeles waltl]|uniref:Dirigent protein n=1 Tax=Pleurodeles waltl TaxID=8319 RepID=A0AAV7MCY3_PLEWA|nr:hypothetical protein NDU88_005711 [Pleurodeles waltl]